MRFLSKTAARRARKISKKKKKKVKGAAATRERERERDRGLCDSVAREKRTPLKNNDTLSVPPCPYFTAESNKRRSVGEITFLERPWKQKKASVCVPRVTGRREREKRPVEKKEREGKRKEAKRDKLSLNRSRSVGKHARKKVFLVE